MSHYGAFKVCNELNARVYWLDHRVTSVGLRPWTVYGVGRDFGMTSEPTKAIKSKLPQGGPTGSVTAACKTCSNTSWRRPPGTFLPRPSKPPFQGAEAFNVRGAVEPIESFVAHRCAVAPEAAELITHGDRQLPIAFDLDDTRLEAHLGPIPRPPHRDGIAETYRRFVQLRKEGRLDLADLG